MSTALSFRQVMGIQPSTATTQDSTLVIVDAQNLFLEGPLQAFEVEKSKAAIAALLQKYRAAGGKVVHVTHNLGVDSVRNGKNIGDEFEELTPIDGEVRLPPKDHTNAFSGTALQEHLDRIGNKKIVITGYAAHVCVSTTARAAFERGYDVIVVEDAVGDRNIPGVDAPLLIKVTLAEIADTFGTVLHSSAITSVDGASKI